ncbi:MAG: hypothetical protein A3C47_03730 [Omnitrophica bacterium RIFCSPHIGHO2_02_FULL_51_18]|nr:MAG: hypothetical protein A3C47_03730 [Omnitrophica bacterium RIFCSPHIGHO2_02_FULL_51_18]
MNRLVHSYSKFLSAVTLVLIIAGGLVTSTESGLSVPDWPLSYGQFFPPMVGGIRFEHTHRLIAGIVGILTFVLLGLLLKNEGRGWVKCLGAAAALAVVLQAILGGLTVIYLLPTPVSVAHACLGQTFFSLVVSLVLFTSKEWATAPKIASENSESLKRLLATTFFFVCLQLIAGSVVRHAHGRTLNLHALLAFLIAIHVLFILVRILRDADLQPLVNHVLLLTGLVTLQVFSGGGAYLLTLVIEKAAYPRTSEVLITTAHQSIGAVILATTLLLMLRSFRLLKPTELRTSHE